MRTPQNLIRDWLSNRVRQRLEDEEEAAKKPAVIMDIEPGLNSSSYAVLRRMYDMAWVQLGLLVLAVLSIVICLMNVLMIGTINSMSDRQIANENRMKVIESAVVERARDIKDSRNPQKGKPAIGR